MNENDKNLPEEIAKFLEARQARLEQYIEDYHRETIAYLENNGFLGQMSHDEYRGRTFDPSDPVVRKAIEICLEKGKFSTGILQTYLGKGHGWVAGLSFWLEHLGVVGPMNGNKPRDMLITSMEEFDKLAKV